MALAGCTTPAAPPAPAPAAPTSTPAAAPTTGALVAATATPVPPAKKYGGTLRMTVGAADSPNLDPHLTNSTALSAAGFGMCWSQLLWFMNGPGVKMPTYEVAGELAESWTQPDDLTYVFKLRPGIKWHNIAPVNGRELTADDLVYSFQRQIDSKVNAALLDGVTRLEAVDKGTLRITVDKPNADLLWSLATARCKVIPKESVAVKGDLKEGPVIGSGPWIFDSFQPNQASAMKRNPDYYFKGQPNLDGVTWLRIGDQATLLNAFRSKNLDLLHTGFTKNDIDELKKQNPELVVRNSPFGSRFEVQLKGDRPPFNDPRAREAFSKAINRQEIISTLFGGVGHLEVGMNVGSEDAALPAAEVQRALAFDPDTAKKLAQDSGLDQVEFEMDVGNFLSGLVAQVAELMQAQLAKANIKVKLKVTDGTAWTQQVRVGGNYHTALGVQARADPPTTELLNWHHSKGPTSTTKISDPQLDAMIERQSTLVRDPAGRAKLLQDIQRKILDLRATIPVATQDTINVNWPYVKDWNNNQATTNTLGDYIHVWFDR
jgi:peptide/nickel transport system substrate-binding protein